ncbi:MAG: PEP-CTERM sorting domain-containing protein [Verrucomicrobia bacterium]|nr:PEP-CTERM sorting domain-containing protein [Verrucomicrobiota bacterium]
MNYDGDQTFEKGVEFSTLMSSLLSMSRRWLIVIAASCLPFRTEAANVVVDFESSLTTYATSVTFSIMGGAAEYFQIITPPAGSWGIMGTQGSSHLGVWGSWTGAGKNGGWTGASDTTYGRIALLGGAKNVTLDVFSASNQTISFYGFAGGSLISTVTPTLALTNVSGTNEYLARTVTLNGVDEIRYNNSNPFGIDNLVIGVPEPSALSLLTVGLGVLFRWSRKRD